jgi:branched-chain amino acid transport system substrate-binding protein
MTRVLALAVAAVLAFACTGQAQQSTGPQKTLFKVGFANDITGPGGSLVGPPFEHGLKLAIDQYNATRPATRIEYVMEDDQGTVETATKVVNKFIIEDKVDLIVGPTSSAQVPAVAPLAAQNKIPLLSFNASGLDVKALNNPYVFSIAITTDLLGQSYVDFIVQKLKLQKIALVASDDAAGQTYTRAVQAEAQKLGAQIVDTEALTPNVIDLTPTATKLKAKAPDAVIMASYTPQTSALAKAAAQQGFKPTWVAGAQQFSAQVIKDGGAAVDGLYAATPFNPTTATSGEPKAFLDAYRSAFGADPDYFAVGTYETGLVVTNAVRKGGGDAASLLKALRGTKGVPGPLGPITLNSSQAIVVGQGGVNIGWSKVSGGQTVPVTG